MLRSALIFAAIATASPSPPPVDPTDQCFRLPKGPPILSPHGQYVRRQLRDRHPDNGVT